MEWQPLNFKEEEPRARPAGGMATRELARKEMARERARIQGKKTPDLHVQALERAGEIWRREKAEENLTKRREEEERARVSVEAVQPAVKEAGRPAGEVKGQATAEAHDQRIVGWLQQGLASWGKQAQPENTRQKGRRLNSASMAVLLRQAVAREKALAFGRKLPDPRVIALEREATRWREEKEEKKRLVRRETGLLRKLVQLAARDGLFDDGSQGKEWGIGRVSCFADRAPRDGWKLIVVAVDRSHFMVRWGWGDLLGLYQAELNDQLRLKSYVRIGPQEIESYLREGGKDGERN